MPQSVSNYLKDNHLNKNCINSIKKILLLILTKTTNIVLAFVTMPFLVRSLSKPDYGTYGQTLLVSGIAITLFSSGLGLVLYLFLSQKNIDYKNVISNNLFLSLIVSTLCFISVFFGADLLATFFENPPLASLLKIYALSYIFSIPSANLLNLAIFYNKIKFTSFIYLFDNILRISLLFIAIFVFKSVKAIFILLTALELVKFLVLYSSFHSRVELRLFELRGMYDQLVKGYPLGLTSLLATLTLYTDGTVVSRVLPIEDYATYKAGAVEIPILSTIYVAIAQILLPKVAKLFVANKFSEILSLKKKVILTTASVLFPITFYIFFNRQDIIVLLFSEKYIASTSVFGIYTLILLIRINDFLDVLIAAGRTARILIIHILTFVVNLVLNILLVEIWGMEGVALATLISLIVYVTVFSYYSSRELKTSFINYLPIYELCIILIVSLLFNFALSEIDVIQNKIVSLFIRALPLLAPVMLFYKLEYIEKRILGNKIKNKLNRLFGTQWL